MWIRLAITGLEEYGIRPILDRGRLQRVSVFSSALILAAVRTECTRAIRCRKRVDDRLARVDWLLEGKRHFQAAF